MSERFGYLTLLLKYGFVIGDELEKPLYLLVVLAFF